MKIAVISSDPDFSSLCSLIINAELPNAEIIPTFVDRSGFKSIRIPETAKTDATIMDCTDEEECELAKSLIGALEMSKWRRPLLLIFRNYEIDPVTVAVAAGAGWVTVLTESEPSDKIRNFLEIAKMTHDMRNRN